MTSTETDKFTWQPDDVHPDALDPAERWPFCFVCSRPTNHVGEHDDLVEQGLARYIKSDVLNAREMAWADAADGGLPSWDDLPEYDGCECELDWDCGRHGGARLTWIETRYQGLDEEEARHFGLGLDLYEPF